jgi:HlyD family secretion protein
MAVSQSRVRRIVVWTVVVGGLVAGGLWLARPRPVPVEAAAVTRGDLQVTLDQEGKTRVRQRYVVSAPVSGRVLRIGLEPGDRVTAGQTEVARLLPDAPPLLDARSRAGAEARVKAAAAGVDQARAVLAQAETARDQAVLDRDRTARLFAGQAVSQSDLDAARTAAKSREQAVDAARAAVVAAQHDLDAAQAALLSATAGSGARSQAITIDAPIDGIVLRRLHESEAVVPAGEPLVEIANVADLEIAADYLSTDAVKIRAGMPAIIDRWGGGATLKGTVRLVEPSGFVKVSALGVEEQRVNVIVDFDDPRSAWQALGDGYRVEVRVVEWEQAHVLQVLTGALFRDGDAWAVFVIQNGVAHLRHVQIGRQTSLQAEVTSGLAEGDRVVVHPSDRVADGVRVNPAS